MKCEDDQHPRPPQRPLRLNASQAPKEEIQSLVGRINAAAKALDTPETDLASNARQNLLLEAKILVASLEDPDAEVWPRAFQVNVALSVDIAGSLGVWDKLRDEEFITLSDAAKWSDATVLVRVLRQLTAAGLLSDFKNLNEPAYALTSLGKPYLDWNHRSFNRFILREVLPTIRDSVEQKCFQTPSFDSVPHNKWLNLAKDPNRAANMARGMRSLSAGGLAVTAYPFGDELAKLNIKDDDIAIVDVAGGQGHIMSDIRKRYPGMKGSIVVQDLQSVIESDPGGKAEGVRFMAHDFFQPQPITTAHVYYLRHIVHDWDDDSMTLILKELVPILKARPLTKLLLADLVLPATDVSMQEAVRDFTMFRIGGLERTEDQWRKLLARSELEIKKIWRGTEPEACVECALIVADEHDQNDSATGSPSSEVTGV
ncbi:hypothetical protein N8I77_005522 [Diaporthe amygdali]|uniref:O-methyltransferase C-terminal domain-containing protein n=1 Tax=Phomopsis amygdali TaxID=1214568 RepID=A0AAD9SEQ9_PHOAM|nr:hypothetical protein N8I77_005522 [Diaporthe amygdali]